MRLSTFLAMLVLLAVLVAVGGLVLRASTAAASFVIFAAGAPFVGLGAYGFLAGVARIVEARQRHRQLPPAPAQPIINVVVQRQQGESRPAQLQRANRVALDAQQGVVPWGGDNGRL
jgi:hypothetical protein